MGSMMWFIGFVALLLPLVTPSQAAAPPKRILALYWYDRAFPGDVAFDRSFQAVLQSAPAGSIEAYTEYVNSNRFPGEHQSEVLHDYLRKKYAGRPIDVVVAVSDVSLEFLLKYRDDLFPHTPIVFVAVKRPATNEPASGPGLTGIVQGGGYKETLDLALRLHPGTKQVFIISGTLDHDKEYETLCREELQGFKSGVSITYLTDFPVDRLIFKMKSLPERSLVLYIWQQSQNEEGNVLESPDVLASIAPSTTAPIYGVASWQIGRGIVGGYLRTFEADATRAGEIALRIANGARARDIPVESAKRIPIFDWGELERWGISEDLLPADSVVLNRRPTVWGSFKWYIIGGIALMLFQMALISGLIWHRARRRRAEGELTAALEVARESEARFRLVANTAPVMIWMSGPDKLCSYVNQPWLDFTGRPLVSELGSGWAEGVHADDLQLCLNTYDQFFQRRKSFKMQYRLRRHDGEYRWVLDTGVPRFSSDGSFAGYIGSCIDMTERKQAEEALSTVSRRLIDAQEQERTRIARELHDDINQRIAMLGIELDVLQQSLPNQGPELQSRIDELRQQTAEIGTDVQGISHRLHSSKLEYLGLVAACKSFCREVAEWHKVDVNFVAENIAPNLSQDISLCLFRVLQESLNNAIKHSGAQHFEAQLRGTSNEIQLTVRDHGIGFDAAAVMVNRGLGFISMRERVSAVNGTILIASKPKGGTEITVRVPVVARAASKTTVGAA